MTSTMPVEIEGKRIAVRWNGYRTDEEFRSDVERIKLIAGRSYVKGERYWTVPLDMSVCRLLREQFGRRLQIGPALHSWATEARNTEDRLGSMAAADTGELRALPNLLPALARAIYLGPLGEDTGAGSYQAADVEFLSNSSAPLNANHQGLGKQLEAIAEVWESGRYVGSHLVICPQVAIEAVWVEELERWQADAALNNAVAIYALSGGSKSQKERLLKEFVEDPTPVKWVVVNPEQLRMVVDETKKSSVAIKVGKAKARKMLDKAEEYREECIEQGIITPEGDETPVTEFTPLCFCSRLADPHLHYVTRYPELGQTTWSTIINDEVHRGNIRNHRSLTSKSLHGLKCNGKRVAMSGTPMRKKGADIWGILHWLRPDVFTS